MDAVHFDTLARLLSTSGSRRRVAGLLSGFALGGALPFLGWGESEAKRKKKKKKKKKKKCAPACLGSTTCQNGQCLCADGRSPCGAGATCCTGTDICLSSGACGPCVGVFSTFPESPSGSTCGTSADCCQTDTKGNPAQISCAPDDFQNTVCVQPVGTECISHFDCNTGVGQCCWGGTTPTRCLQPDSPLGCAP